MEELVSVVNPTVKHLAEGRFDFNEIITWVFRAQSEIKGPLCQSSWHLMVKNSFNTDPRFLTRKFRSTGPLKSLKAHCVTFSAIYLKI